MMLAPEQTVQNFALPTIELRSLARRAAVPALLAAAALATVLLLAGRSGARAGHDRQPRAARSERAPNRGGHRGHRAGARPREAVANVGQASHPASHDRPRTSAAIPP